MKEKTATMTAAEGQEPVDLTNCDREPIHILGQVQSFGCLIAVSTDWIVTHASVNVASLLGLDEPIEAGQPLAEILPSETMRRIRGHLQTNAGNLSDSHTRIFGIDVTQDGRLFDASIHQSGRHLVLEFEPKPAVETERDMDLVQALVSRIKARDTVGGRCEAAARGLRALTGFDRVMVYRFNDDDSGTVVAEDRRADLESFLDLRYPASDIPKQARALYKRSVLRLIADVDAAPVDIEPSRSPEGQPLDLSLAVTRSVSPIHLEYLRNMGVGASMSVSILRGGELWGLLACHHMEPLHLDYQLRTMVELYAQIFTYELAQAESEAEFAAADRARDMHDRLMSRMSQGDLTRDFDLIADEIAKTIAFDGIAIYTDGVYKARGAAPSAEEFLPVARFLNTTATSTIFSTVALQSLCPAASNFADRAVGILALPVSRTPRDYIVLFRREVVASVRWAGNPEKPVTAGPNGTRLTPRKSFEAWQEMVRGRSAPWTRSELRAAEALRVTLIEIVLKLSDEASKERQRAIEKQELLIAELNHRVRNILNLIRGLMTQTRSGASSLEDYTDLLGSRIHALARAHDQLTAHKWNAAPLKALIEIETEAFSSYKASRVRITGDDVALTPNAYSAFALVIHELMTNAAKYGALSDSTGEVAVKIDRKPDGTLFVSWVERGGPPVKAPTREGFGTTVIDRSVPFELGGKANVYYEMAGVRAEFVVPARHVVDAETPEHPTGDAVPEKSPADDGPPKGVALLVEDNMIISLDTSDALTEMGATEVLTAARVADALKALDKLRPDYALLDVNLGDETSILVAERLQDMGVPFVLATGYGGENIVLDTFPQVPVLKKPYQPEEIRRALAHIS